MPELKLLSLTDIQSLEAQAAKWDDLWQRSEVSSPALQAAMIGSWFHQFAVASDFRAVVVSQQDRWIAALPLVRRRMAGVVDVGGLPISDWCACGDLLVDERADIDGAVAKLAAGVMQLPWPLLWLDGVAIDTPRWQALRHALDAVGMAVNVDARFDIGRVEIDHDWQRYQAGWSRTHRRNMKRYSRKLQETGELELRDYTAVTPAEVEGLLRRGLEVEDRSWKGAAGTSVLRSEGMFEYFVRNSRLLAERGQLELVFLEHNGQPIAFELGWYAKGVYHAYKVGYDEAFAAAAPGQLLRYLLFERFYGESPRRAVDFAGVLSDATGKWCTSTYRVGRLLVAPRKLIGRLALSAYRNLWPHLRRLRRPATT